MDTHNSTEAHDLVDQIRRLAAQQAEASAAREPLLASLQAVLSTEPLAASLIDAIVTLASRSGSAADAGLAAHLADAEWSRSFPLSVQPYAPIFAPDPQLHLTVPAGLAAATWPRDSLVLLQDALISGNPVDAIVRTLADGFAHVLSQVRSLVDRLDTFRTFKKASSMHVVQIEAILAAEEVAGGVAGKRAIDLGSGNGEIVAYLNSQGAVAQGSEADTAPHTLLGVQEVPEFDLVFATGFMEPGAYFWPGKGANYLEYNSRADELLTAAARLLRPEGLLVVRNVNHPLPFTAGAIHAAGLTYQPLLMPLCVPSFGGRLAVWRKAA